MDLFEIKAVMQENPAYGSPRLSIALNANHKKVEMKANQLKAEIFKEVFFMWQL
ncbi:MAG: transposase [Proteobacteria bacterium]|nr:transposase [Pseudomonadota bacterium]